MEAEAEEGATATGAKKRRNKKDDADYATKFGRLNATKSFVTDMFAKPVAASPLWNPNFFSELKVIC
jgi:hypothetical protein